MAFDLRSDTPQARFLDREVDRHSELGHDATFLAPGELTRLLEAAGFREVTEHAEAIPWRFPDRPAAIEYCRTLFRMTRATLAETALAIDRHLEMTSRADGVLLGWGLRYARGRKLDV